MQTGDDAEAERLTMTRFSSLYGYYSLEDESKNEARAEYYNDKLAELMDEGVDYAEAKRIASEYADNIIKKAYKIPDYSDKDIPW